VQTNHLHCPSHTKKNCRRTLPKTSIGAAVLGFLWTIPHATHAQDSGAGVIQEVLVTAQKREENIQDVPIPVSVISGQTLTDTNQVRLREYYSMVPGLSVTPQSGTAQMLSIRGITTGSVTIPTVGFTIDDVPYGGSTVSTAGQLSPDIDPGELARVEVLRGPQGTLYGSNSMGGLIRFVTIDPSTESLSGRVQAGTSDVYHGAQPGFELRASANIPLTDTLAVRASGFSRQDPGYIDNPVLGLKGVNEAQTYGGRLAAMWRLTDNLSFKLNAMLQTTKQNGSNEVEFQPGLSGLQQNNIADTGQYSVKDQAYGATLNYKLGNVELTSVTGYNVNRSTDVFDYTSTFSTLTQKQFGVTGTPLYEFRDTEKITQEIRASIHLWDRIDWLLGGFYTHEANPAFQILSATDPANGHVVGQWAYFDEPSTFREYAGFTDLTYHFTDQFDIQLGARESQTKEIDGAYDTGPLNGPTPIIATSSSVGNAFTYLVTPRFKLTPDFMVYARLASGYRPGGPNASASVLLGAPASFKPDKTINYEVGAKGDFLDHLLTLDLSAYYIQWKDIQLNLATPQNFQYTGNGSNAKSEGVDLALTARPLTGLTISSWVSYNEAVLTEAMPPGSTAYGVVGNRLPNTSRWSGNLSLQQDFPLSASANGFVGGQVSYVGDRLGPFQSTALRQDLGSYTKTDLRGGIKYDSWTTSVYVNNVADTRGTLGGGLGYLIPYAFFYIQPRTVGLNVSKTF
jgi:iron complex outermembrane recepter protein